MTEWFSQTIKMIDVYFHRIQDSNEWSHPHDIYFNNQFVGCIIDYIFLSIQLTPYYLSILSQVCKPPLLNETMTTLAMEKTLKNKNNERKGKGR